jgi:hypothetical protein
MRLSDIKNIERIIEDSYNDPGDGILLSDFWINIEKFNPEFTTKRKNQALLAIIEKLLKNNLITVNKTFKENKDKAIWNKSLDEFVDHLDTFLNKSSTKKLEQDPESVFIQFDYEFVDWKISWPFDLEKYDLKSA